MKLEREEKPQRPTVVIDLPLILESFCRWAFKVPADSVEIYAPRTHSIGRAVIGYLSKADRKPVLPEAQNPVTFIVPETKLNWYSLQTKYLYFSAEDRESFVHRVEIEFANFCELHFKDGYAMNMDQLAIIESILDILNVRMNTANFDAVKKNDYRNRKAEIRKRSKAILKQRKLVS